MTRSQSEGTATPKKLQRHVPNNKTLHKISLKPGLNLSIFPGSTPKSFKSLIYYKIILLTLLEETTSLLENYIFLLITQGHPTAIFGKYLFGRRFEI